MPTGQASRGRYVKKFSTIVDSSGITMSAFGASGVELDHRQPPQMSQ
jgi:hypothetical protein